MTREAEPQKVRFHFIKSNSFRVVHADGVYGGPTPQGHMHLAFFSERIPIPQSVEHAVTSLSDGRVTVGEEVSRLSREGIVREVEVGVVMDFGTARILHRWLGEHLKTVDAATVSVKGNKK